jgi:membrane-associated phospholipid phosphatase
VGTALVLLAALVVTGHVDGFDRAVNSWLPAEGVTGLIGAGQVLGSVVPDVANPRVVAPASILAALWLAGRGRRDAVRVVLVPTIVISLAVLVLKVAVRRAGPPGQHAVRLLGWWPSGHTATNVVCSVAVATVLGGRWPRVIAVGWSILVAATMVWIHAHWVSDVVGGALLGVLVLLLT